LGSEEEVVDDDDPDLHDSGSSIEYHNITIN
jgi:hypothetical protein